MTQESILPIIDWDLAIKLAGDNRAYAEEMLSLFIASLPAELQSIQVSLVNNNLSDLAKILHKFRGGLSYCGLPRLKEAVLQFETAVKKQETVKFSELFSAVKTEIHHVLQLTPAPQ